MLEQTQPEINYENQILKENIFSQADEKIANNKWVICIYLKNRTPDSYELFLDKTIATNVLG